jgi:hypothetical protein
MYIVDTFYVHKVYFTAIWNILWLFGTFYGHLCIFPVLVCCTKNNLATLTTTRLHKVGIPSAHILIRIA